eukprot:gene6707-10872_t
METATQFGALKGVVRTSVGYCGGDYPYPSYHDINDHSESIKIEYNPEEISYETLLHTFWKNHCATFPEDRRDTQYLSIIFFHNEEQKKIALKVASQQPKKVYTFIEPFKFWTEAEFYHQKYLLQGKKEFMGIFNISKDEFVFSEVATKMNGYVGGNLDISQVKDFLKDSKKKSEIMKIITNSSNDDNKTSTQVFIDGGIAGMVGVTATFPLDLAKTRLQNTLTTGQKSNLFTVLQNLKKTDGVKSWYRGFSINFGMITFEKAIKLTFNDWFRSALTNKQTGELSVFSQVLAGGSAGFFQSCVTTPMELLKIKMQIGEKHVLQNFIKNEGFLALYRGWGATLIRDIPFSCFYFPIYANLKELQPFGGGSWWNLSSGLLSGGFSGWLVTPMDVIKTRLQANKGDMTWISCARDIYKNEGITTFFKGSVPRMICTGSLFAVAQVMYELKFGDKIINKFTTN